MLAKRELLFYIERARLVNCILQDTLTFKKLLISKQLGMKTSIFIDKGQTWGRFYFINFNFQAKNCVRYLVWLL